MENNNTDLDKAIEYLRAKNSKKEYKVGYGKPPKDTRFKKGVSGNPKGIKKKPLPLTLEESIKLELNKEMTIINKDGVKEKMSYYTLLARSFVQDAIKNDGPSRKILLQYKNILKCNIPEAIKFIDERNKPVDVEEMPEEIRKMIIKGLCDKLDIINQQNSNNSLI